MRTFQSRVDGGYWLLMAVTAALLLSFFWLHAAGWAFLAAAGMILEIEMLVHTCYRMDGGCLWIASGRFVPGRHITLSSIVRVRRVRAFSLAPALSARRLRIDYRKDDGEMASVQVSPQNEEEFLRWMRKKNNLLIIE